MIGSPGIGEQQLAKDKRVAFLSYESLGKQYEQEFEKQKFEFVI